jgi:hypothetical protein
MFLASSCTTYFKSIPTPVMNAQVNIDFDDLEYVGDVTGTSTQSYVLGIPYGGRRYYVATTGGFLSQIPFIGNNRGTNNALYDALMQKANADFVLPISVERKVHQMFLGSKQIVTLRAKAFRIKSK